MKDENFITIQGWMSTKLKLSGNELILYAIIYGKSNKTQQGFYGTPKYMANKLSLTHVSVLNILSKLVAKELIYREQSISDEKVYTKLNNMDSITGCIFCAIDDIPLDDHHFPIRAKDGGVETIRLCPNCHRRFHVLADFNYKYKVKINDKK